MGKQNTITAEEAPTHQLLPSTGEGGVGVAPRAAGACRALLDLQAKMLEDRSYTEAALLIRQVAAAFSGEPIPIAGEPLPMAAATTAAEPIRRTNGALAKWITEQESVLRRCGWGRIWLRNTWRSPDTGEEFQRDEAYRLACEKNGIAIGAPEKARPAGDSRSVAAYALAELQKEVSRRLREASLAETLDSNPKTVRLRVLLSLARGSLDEVDAYLERADLEAKMLSGKSKPGGDFTPTNS